MVMIIMMINPVRGLSEHSLENKGKQSASTSGSLLPGTDRRQGGSGNRCFLDAFLGSFAERRAQRDQRGGSRPPRSAPRRFAAVFLELGAISRESFCDLSRAGRFFGHFDWAHIAIRAGRERPAPGRAFFCL